MAEKLSIPYRLPIGVKIDGRVGTLAPGSVLKIDRRDNKHIITNFDEVKWAFEPQEFDDIIVTKDKKEMLAVNYDSNSMVTKVFDLHRNYEIQLQGPYKLIQDNDSYLLSEDNTHVYFLDEKTDVTINKSELKLKVYRKKYFIFALAPDKCSIKALFFDNQWYEFPDPNIKYSDMMFFSVGKKMHLLDTANDKDYVPSTFKKLSTKQHSPAESITRFPVGVKCNGMVSTFKSGTVLNIVCNDDKYIITNYGNVSWEFRPTELDDIIVTENIMLAVNYTENGLIDTTATKASPCTYLYDLYRNHKTEMDCYYDTYGINNNHWSLICESGYLLLLSEDSKNAFNLDTHEFICRYSHYPCTLKLQIYRSNLYIFAIQNGYIDNIYHNKKWNPPHSFHGAGLEFQNIIILKSKDQIILVDKKRDATYTLAGKRIDT